MEGDLWRAPINGGLIQLGPWSKVERGIDNGTGGGGSAYGQETGICGDALLTVRWLGQ